MRFFGLGFQGTNQNPLLARSIWRNLTQSVVKFPPNHPFAMMCSCRQRTRAKKLQQGRKPRSADGGAERSGRHILRKERARVCSCPPCTLQGRTEECNFPKRTTNSPYAFRRPFKISLRFLCRFQSLVETGAHSFQATLSKCLKLKQFLLFCIQVSGPIGVLSAATVFR